MSTDTKPKHTPEPWHQNLHTREPWHPDGAGVYDDWGRRVALCAVTVAEERDKCLQNSARIVACVNACAGIEDVAATLAEVREYLKDRERFEAEIGNAKASAKIAALLAKLIPTA